MEQAPETTEPGQDRLDALIALYRQGQLAAALAQGAALAAQFPRSAQLDNILGAVNGALGQHDAAIAHYRRAIEIRPDFASAHGNLANSYNNAGQTREAIASYRRAIEIKPDYAIAHNNLGNILLDVGRGEEAIASFQRAVQFQPDNADLFYNMANALTTLDRRDEAVKAFEDALRIKPDHADALNNLGNLLKELGRLGDSIASFRQAATIRPDHVDTLINLGLALRGADRKEEAAACFTRVVQLQPERADAHATLGATLEELGRREEAVASLEQALRLSPGDDALRARKLHQHAHLCDWDALSSEAGRIAELGVAGQSVTPFGMLGLEDSPERHRIRSGKHAFDQFGSIAAVPIDRPGKRPERLRIGYFSADFHDHATMYLMAGLFELHDRDRFEIHAYSYGPDRDDAMRRWLKAAADHFHDVRSPADEEIAELARRHGIDVAIDLKGYTRDSRPGIFAHRAAPLQIAYLGYPGTSGAPFIDYLIADRIVVPDELRQHYSERVIRMPDSYQVNDDRRPIAAGTVSRAGAGLPEGAFVFCCFNNSYKITPAEFDIWMRLLGRVEDSVLWLLKTNRSVDARLREEARKRGIDPGRLIFAEPIAHGEHLARHALADLFLDTFNYNAHTTGSDALWAGVPLVTRTGRGFAARVATSLVHAIGLPELATGSAEDYEALALALATDSDRLSATRERLAVNRLTQPLFRTERFVRTIEAAYDRAFQALIDGKAPADFDI